MFQYSGAISETGRPDERDRFLEELEDEERRVSKKRARLHERIDFLRANGNADAGRCSCPGDTRVHEVVALPFNKMRWGLGTGRRGCVGFCDVIRRGALPARAVLPCLSSVRWGSVLEESVEAAAR